ncbi:MAG: phosphoribosylformylglycinamidine synthase subunit PurS [Gemmatimonadota bacterium]
MTRYLVEVRVTPREGLLDPQGRAVETALTSLGFDTAGNIRVGKLVRMLVEADSEASALEQVQEMCDQLIANPVTEEFDVRILGNGDAAAEPS